MRRREVLLALAAALASAPSFVRAAPPKAGVVVMHGKGGKPEGVVQELASYLEGQGFIVANLEMPWSGRREYDVDVAAAEKQVAEAIATLRERGAAKVFVAGHSQGGVFALYLGGRIPVDGLIAIAPGGNVAASTFREQVGESVSRARRLVAEGRGTQRERFVDYEGSRGTSPVVTTAATYLAWFDPDGAMNQLQSEQKLDPKLPVLYVAPTGDYPALRRAKQAMFDALPRNPLTRLHEPDATHIRAPAVAREEIARWIEKVAGR